MFRFGLKLCVLMAAYYGLILLPFFDRLLYDYLRANAWAANAIIHWLGGNSQVSEVTIRSGTYAITVRRGCDAIEPAWFFCAAIFSFPGTLPRKVLGILMGVPAILSLNLARIVSLFFIGLDWPGFFNAAHLEIWPTLFIVAAILLWVGWIRWAGRITQSNVRAT